AGRGGAPHPGRLRQRLALQRRGRDVDPADTGRRVRRARAGRAQGARPLAERRRRAPCHVARRLAHGRGGVDPLPLEGGAASQPLPRRGRDRDRGGTRGQVTIGNNRYSTTGSSQWANAQPLVQHGRARTVALGHNGNLINVSEVRDGLRASGVSLSSTSDSELIAALIANDTAPLEE